MQGSEEGGSIAKEIRPYAGARMTLLRRRVLELC